MGVTVTAPNNGSDYVEFKNQTGTSLAKVGGYDDGSSNGHLEFYTTVGGTSTEKARIDSVGNVGIGTNSPSTTLDITSANTAVANFNGTGSNGSAIKLQSSGTNVLFMGSSKYITGGSASEYGFGTTGATPVFFATNSTERMRIDSSGNVGIGIATNTTARLCVNGGSLPSSDTVNALSMSSTLGATRLITDAGNKLSFIGSYYDNTALEISQGSTLAYTSGIVVAARSATSTVSDAVAVFTRGTERMRIDSSGQLKTMVTGGSAVMNDYGCRAWVNFNGTGTVAILGSGNVSSITDNGTGQYTVNFTTSMPDANYCGIVNAGNNGFSGNSGTASAGSMLIATRNAAAALTDYAMVCVSIFR